MTANELLSHSLGEHVGRVPGPEDLGEEEEVPFANPLLNPELPRCEVSYFANASPPTDANGGTAVGAHLERERQTKVCGQARHTQPLCGSLYHPSELGLP